MSLLQQIFTFVTSVFISIRGFAMFGWNQFAKIIFNMLITFRLKPEPEKEGNPSEVLSSSINRTAVLYQPNVTQAKGVKIFNLGKRSMIPQRNKSRVKVAPKNWKAARVLVEDFRPEKLKTIARKVAFKPILAGVNKRRYRRKIKKVVSSRANRQCRMAQERCETSLQKLAELQLQVKLKRAELQKAVEQMNRAEKSCSNLKVSLRNTKKQVKKITKTVRKREARQNSNLNPEMDDSTLAMLHDVFEETPRTDIADVPTEENEALKIEAPQSENQTVQTEVPCDKESEQNLDHPLAHYYIKGSHNTYLLGNQLNSASTIDGYRLAIANKCKCLEMDLHDGPHGEPVIYHGWTLTPTIVARHVLQHGIKPNFSKDDLPLILNMDDNIRSVEQRKLFIQHIHTILGDFIYIENIEEMACLPSPNQLRGKIIIKAPRAKWGELVNICQSVPFPHSSLDENSDNGKWFEVSSLSENKLHRILKSSIMDRLKGNGRRVEKAKKLKMREITANQLIRYYPGGHRQLSGNFNPIPGMNAGCQIAAMNIQTKCSDLAIYESRFNYAGNCGYALKPAFLLDRTAPRSSPKRITVKVISGHDLPQMGKNRRIPTYVKIRVDGNSEDKKKKSTRKVKDDGLNCIWEEELGFDVSVPELGFLLFQVKRSQFFGLRRTTVASCAVPVVNLVNGLCSIPLRDGNLVTLEKAHLLIQVKIEDRIVSNRLS